jgi:hypothetical protein
VWEKIKENGMEIFMLFYATVTMFVVAGVILHSWPKALLYIGLFPILAIGAFAIIYTSFLLAALIYGGIFNLLGRKW